MRIRRTSGIRIIVWANNFSVGFFGKIPTYPCEFVRKQQPKTISWFPFFPGCAIWDYELHEARAEAHDGAN